MFTSHPKRDIHRKSCSMLTMKMMINSMVKSFNKKKQQTSLLFQPFPRSYRSVLTFFLPTSTEKMKSITTSPRPALISSLPDLVPSAQVAVPRCPTDLALPLRGPGVDEVLLRFNGGRSLATGSYEGSLMAY